MSIILIAAMSTNRVIGKDNTLPWHLPEDLKHFKKLTYGHTVVMGRKTYESIGFPLPKRQNIVLTRDEEWDDARVMVINDVDAFMQMYNANISDDLYIIGGAQIYQYFLPLADKIELTQIRQTIEGDTFFPVFESDFVEVARDEQDGYDFVSYTRKGSR